MPYRKLLAIINGGKAVQSEEIIELLHVVANPSLLQTKKGQKEYPNLFKLHEKQTKEFGIKTITVEADMSQLIAMKQSQAKKLNRGVK